MSKLEKLQKILLDKNIDYLLVPMRDEFGCEYVPPQGKRVEFLTGFTGSNAFVIIASKGKSAFFTDGRYSLQASKQVSLDDYDVFELPEYDQYKWLKEKADKSKNVAFNSAVFRISDIEKVELLAKENLFKLTSLDHDLIDKIWSNKPKPNYSKAFLIDNKNRIEELTSNMQADVMFETDPENIAYLLNVRGKDLDYTPVILAFALIYKTGETILFSENQNLKELNFDVKSIRQIEGEFEKLKSKEVQVDPKNCPQKYKNFLEQNGAEILQKTSPLILQKAIKTTEEIDKIKQAHIADGVALVAFYIWLEQEFKNGNFYTEYQLAKKLNELRSKNPAFYSLSFDAIVGFKDNGAIIHYKPEEDTSKLVSGDGMLLIDSGAQYFSDDICGTTDVTRTTYFGEPSTEEKERFTLVLKGHIAVANAKLEKGKSGKELDVAARKFLQEKGLDYKHGTGHGVGYFLNVHEGPHGISKINDFPLEKGMIISNEPGYYKEGAYGIRIESLIYVKKSQNLGFLEFETLTKFPIDKNLVSFDMLTEQEKNWLNDYHQEVYDDLSPYLEDHEKEWLKEKTKF